MTAEVEANNSVDTVENTKDIANKEQSKAVVAIDNGKLIMDNEDGKRHRRERSPIVKGRAVKGTVKWFSYRKGYGFIHREDDETDIFVHGSAIVRQTRQPLTLYENQEVEFDIIRGVKGLLEATCVSGPDGIRVGSFVTPYVNHRGPSMNSYRQRSESDATASDTKHVGQPQKAITEGDQRQSNNGSGDNDKSKGKRRNYYKRFATSKNSENKHKEEIDDTESQEEVETAEKEDGKNSEGETEDKKKSIGDGKNIPE